MDTSVFMSDEQKYSADNISNANITPISTLIKQNKEYNISDVWRTGRLSRNGGKDL